MTDTYPNSIGSSNFADVGLPRTELCKYAVSVFPSICLHLVGVWICNFNFKLCKWCSTIILRVACEN
jgi:hypothetical protein